MLNAKQHAREAEIVAQAGRPKMVTIATNMAGRGTDIVLGGNPEPEINRLLADETLDDAARQKRAEEIRFEWQKLHNQVVAAGGLHIVGTERHESRRIDNQLRGRSGRQGDPGSSRFYLSLEDPLLRIFASDRVAAIMERLKMPEGEAIEHPWVTRSIENAQRKVEARNFDMRKHLLEYDDVANDQRKVIYQQRNELLDTDDITRDARRDARRRDHQLHRAAHSAGEPGGAVGRRGAGADAGGRAAAQAARPAVAEGRAGDGRGRCCAVASSKRRTSVTATRSRSSTRSTMRRIERAIMLQSLDTHWREHLSALDQLRQGIHLRGYAQKNPTQEYKREAFELFSLMLGLIKTEVTKVLMTVQFSSPEELAAVEEPEAPRNIQYQHAEFSPGIGDDAGADAAEPTPKLPSPERPQPFVRAGQKVGRNDPCPCGSGKKYKQCHGTSRP